MFPNKLKLLLCAALLAGSSVAVNAQDSAGSGSSSVDGWTIPNIGGGIASFAIPTQPLAVPPGMVPMIVYVPAQQMQAPIPPHAHAPQAAQTINATHCSVNDVAVLTKDAPSCQKAGGKVVEERASFSETDCIPTNWLWKGSC